MQLAARGLALRVAITVVAFTIPSAESQDQIQVGYATLTPETNTVAPAGSAVFSYTNPSGVLISQAGVGAVTPTRNGRIFVDQAGTATALALANPSSVTASATLTLRDAGGSPIGASKVQVLGPGEHIAAYVFELFGGAAAGIRGSLTFVSDQPLAAIALRESRNGYGEPVYATLPVSDLSAALVNSPLSFPHIAAGENFTTQLVLVNTTASTMTGRVRFANDSGVPMILGVNGSPASESAYSLPPHGTYLAELTSDTGLAAGSATVTPDSGQSTPAGTAIFRYRVSGNLVTEAAAYATATRRSRMVVDYLGTQTGVAVSNPAATAATVTFTLMDRYGNVADTASRSVPANGHLALFVHEMFPDVADPFSGLLDIASATPVAPVTLKVTYNSRQEFILTTLPVADLTAPATASQIVFPHLVLGAGWSTQLFLVNSDLTKAASGRVAFVDSQGRAILTTLGGQSAGDFPYQVVAGGGRRFIPGNSATAASALVLDPATKRATTEVTVNTGGTVSLPLLVYDSTGTARDDFNATVVSSNPNVALASAAGLTGRQAGFSTLSIAVSGTATTVTATVVDVQTGVTGYQPTGIVQDLAQRVYLSSSSDNTILLAQNLRSTPATYAGITRSPGLTNDLRLQSRFNSPAYMVLNQADGTLYVSDSGNNVIRRVFPGTNGRVETFAGTGTVGSQDGPLSQASFNKPQGIALDDSGGLWIADSGNHTIRRIRLQTGVVETIAGHSGVPGLADGTGDAARFQAPLGIAVEHETLAQQLERQRTGAAAPAASVIVADTENGRLRRVKESGEVSTLAPTGSTSSIVSTGKGFDAASVAPAFSSPTGVAIDATGNIYVTEPAGGKLKLLLTNGSLVSGAQRKTFASPKGVSFTAAGSVVVADDAKAAQEVVFGEPDITTVSPNRSAAAGGQQVLIEGHNFSSESIVIIGGVLAKNVRVENTERISATTPVLPSGITTLTVQNRAGIDQISFVVEPLPLSSLPAGYITTFAGGTTFLGDGGKATAARFFSSSGIAVDTFGNTYFTDSESSRVRKISASTKVITTIAGSGQKGFSGDGALATTASLDSPFGIAVDQAGNVYISDSGNGRIRKVTAGTGIITTIAGGGASSGDAADATTVLLRFPAGIAVDSAGNLFIAEIFGYKIRRVALATGAITTVAGTGTAAFGGDGGVATGATLEWPRTLAVAPNGDIYIADKGRVRKVAADTKIISTVFDPGVDFLGGVAIDSSGNPFVSAAGRVYRLDRVSLSSTVVYEPSSYDPIALIGDGTLIIVESHRPSYLLVKVDLAASVRTVIAGSTAVTTDIGAPASTAALFYPCGLAVDASGTVYVADYSNFRTVKIMSGGLLTMLSEEFPNPSAIAFAPNGLLFALGNAGLYNINTSDGSLTTRAGGFAVGFSGDGGPAIDAKFNIPLAIGFDSSGNIFVADYGNYRVRMINAQTGIITTVAGNGQSGTTGDNGPALNASFFSPHGVVVDTQGNLFILDGAVIRKVAAGTGTITTFARSLMSGFNGITIDRNDNLFVAAGYKILKISPGGVITTVAGVGEKGYSGDGGPAINARFNFGGQFPPLPGLAFDASGNLYIADVTNDRIRVIKGPIP
jgi:sugar lactone lactonase YvrE